MLRMLEKSIIFILVLVFGSLYCVSADTLGQGAFSVSAPDRSDPRANLARNMLATASTVYKSQIPGRAVDGFMDTRWESEWIAPPQWWAVDLGSLARIHLVRIHWEPAFSKAYRLQVSLDNREWQDVFGQKDCLGGVEEIPLKTQGRYLRLCSDQRATPWGVSFWEFEVFGSTEGPVAAFRGSNKSPLMGSKVSFDASDSTYPKNSIVSYEWDFGDGSKASGKEADHTWNTDGAYTVVLTVKGKDGLMCILPARIDVRSTLPQAAFSVGPVLSLPGKPARFDASAAMANLGELVDWQWDFGDGSSGKGVASSHIYKEPGYYPVKLTVKDSEGRSHTTQRTYVVDDSFAPPLRVEGSKILDARGKEVVLRGFAIYDPIYLLESDIDNYKAGWHVNAVRLALGSERLWYEKSPEKRKAYLDAADKVIQWCFDRHIYVVLDGFHESGNTGNADFHMEKAKSAWRILAPRYADKTHVIWEIYNEPYEISWSAWVDMATELVDIILAEDPVVKACIVPGVVWAQHAFPDRKKVEREQMIYSFHPYAHVYDKVWNQETWDYNIGYIVQKGIAPIFCGEWAIDYPFHIKEYAEPLLKFMDDNRISHTYWGYFPGWGENLVTNGREDPEKISYKGEYLLEYLLDRNR